MDEARYAPPKAAVSDVGQESDARDQSRRLRWAANAALAFALILFYRLGGLHIRLWPGLVQLLFVLAMAFGVLRRSRLCAVIVTMDFALCVLVWARGPMNLVFMLACLGIGCFLLLGAVAAFQFHRLPSQR